MAKEFAIEVQGLRAIADSLQNAAGQIHGAVMYALHSTADEIRDKARANVPSSTYNLSHLTDALQARMLAPVLQTAEIGYFTPPGDDHLWHLKFYEKGAVRKTGTIQGSYFLREAGINAEDEASANIEEALEHMLRRNGLTP